MSVALGTSLPGMFTQSQDGITAKASGTAANSPELVYGPNRVETVASDDDGVLLPPARPRAQVLLHNADASQDIKVFGQTWTNDSGDSVTDSVNGTAGGTGITMGEGTIAWLYCVTEGEWIAAVSVVSTGIAFPTS